MQRFKNVLTIHTQQIGGEAALGRAAALAHLNGARLTVLEVFERLPKQAVASVGPLIADLLNVERRYLEERQAHLDRLTESIRRDGVEVRAAVRHGPPFLEIIRLVLQAQHDLVILAADGWQGLRDITFGSTSMHVMRKCPCPVWVIKPSAEPRFHRILAAVSADPAEQQPDPLDLKIMQMASSLARMENCQLDVLKAWDFIGSDLGTSLSEISDEIRERLVEKNVSDHRAAVDRLLTSVDLEGVNAEVFLPRGDARVVIPEVVEERKADLIVMGTVTRSGIAGFLIGATAEDVLQQVDCSVLTIKPDGFQSPIAASA